MLQLRTEWSEFGYDHPSPDWSYAMLQLRTEWSEFGYDRPSPDWSYATLQLNRTEWSVAMIVLHLTGAVLRCSSELSGQNLATIILHLTGALLHCSSIRTE